MVLREEDLGIVAGLQVFSAHPGHILDDDGSDLSGLNVSNQVLPSRTVKVTARPAVVGIVFKGHKAVLLGVILQKDLLRLDRHTVPGGFVVPGEALV